MLVVPESQVPAIVQEMIARNQIAFMVAVREKLTASLQKHNMILGNIDLIHRTEERMLLLPDSNVYQLQGRVYKADKTRAVGFTKEFVANIGFDTDSLDVHDMVQDLSQDILLALSSEDIDQTESKVVV